MAFLAWLLLALPLFVAEARLTSSWKTLCLETPEDYHDSFRTDETADISSPIVRYFWDPSMNDCVPSMYDGSARRPRGFNTLPDCRSTCVITSRAQRQVYHDTNYYNPPQQVVYVDPNHHHHSRVQDPVVHIPHRDPYHHAHSNHY